jgi:hypothetical protein
LSRATQNVCPFVSRPILLRVARLFLIKYTKKVKLYRNYHKFTKWPYNIQSGRKILKMAKIYTNIFHSKFL